ncbi:GGDEF domain-containing protein [Rummeliibacillus sp. NPDC094406]
MNTIMDGHKISITISIGIANFPDNRKSISELVTATDRALMQATSQGKN